MQATKLPLTPWLMVFYLIGQAKMGISSLELSRHLVVNSDTASLLPRMANPTRWSQSIRLLASTRRSVDQQATRRA